MIFNVHLCIVASDDMYPNAFVPSNIKGLAHVKRDKSQGKWDAELCVTLLFKNKWEFLFALVGLNSWIVVHRENF